MVRVARRRRRRWRFQFVEADDETATPDYRSLIQSVLSTILSIIIISRIIIMLLLTTCTIDIVNIIEPMLIGHRRHAPPPKTDDAT